MNLINIITIRVLNFIKFYQKLKDLRGCPEGNTKVKLLNGILP